MNPASVLHPYTVLPKRIISFLLVAVFAHGTIAKESKKVTDFELKISPVLSLTTIAAPIKKQPPMADRVVGSVVLIPNNFRRTSDLEESPLFSKLPESLSFETGQLDTIIGKPIVEISIPENLRKFTDANVIEQISLPQAIKLALDFSRDVKIAQSRVDQAQSQANQARGILLPNLSVRSSSGRETSSPGSLTDPATGNAKVRDSHVRRDDTITFRQPLLDAPSLSDWQRRDLIVDSRVGTLRGSEGDAYIATVQAYLNLASTLLLTDLYKDYEQQLGLLLNYVSQRAAAGASTDSDMERVKARSLSARSARLEQEAAYSAAVVEFVRLTNVAPKAILLPRRKDASGQVPTELEQALQLGLDTNPELKVLKAELSATEKDITAARSRYLPRLDLELTDSKVLNAGGALGLQHDQRAMLVLNWNLLNGSSDLYNLKEKQERKAEFEWRVDDQQRRLKQSLSAQYATLDATRSRLAAGYTEWNSIYTAARAMSQRMLAGNQSLLDLLDVLERVQQARARLITLHALEISSLAQISRLVGKLPDGSLLEEPVPAVPEAPLIRGGT